MALNFLKFVSKIDDLKGNFCGLDNYQKLPDGNFSVAVIFTDDIDEYCIIGGTYAQDNVQYCGLGIGKWDKSANSYVIGDETLERIPLFKIVNDNGDVIKSKHIPTIMKVCQKKILPAANNVNDMVCEIYKYTLELDRCDYLLLGSQFKSLFPIPYTVNDKGFFYQEGTIFICQGFTDIPAKNGDIVRKIKLVHRKSQSEIFIDSTLLWYAFRMVYEKGNNVNVFASRP